MLSLCYSGWAQIPSITSISPISGVPGSSVVITGANFNGTLANNAVFFNGARGIVTAVSATQLTVTVPVGARTGFIDVVNLTSFRQAKSRSQYIVTFNGSSFSSTSLASPVNFTTTTNANKIELADIDGDGKLDIVAGVATSLLGILRNTTTTSTPSFASSVAWNTAIPYVENDFSIGDLNSDGKLDIYQTGIIGNTSQQGYVSQNSSTAGSISSTGALRASGTSATNQAMRASAIADLSSPADGKPDLIWNFEASGGINNSYLYTNVNTGASPALNFAVNTVLISSSGSARMWAPVAADFDGDGLNDVATYETNGARKLIVSRNTTGGFTNSYYQIDIGANSPQAGRMAVYDVDADGKPDLVLMVAGNVCRVYRNSSTPGALNFTLAGDFGATVSNKAYFTMGDVTGDGKLDLVFACNSFTGSIAVLPNTTTGGTVSFGTAITFAGQAFTDVAVGDLNADGKPDIVGVNTLNSFASVYVNNTATIVNSPTISSFSPVSGPVGTSVVITGTNFTGATAVSFNGVAAASFVVNSPTQITASVAIGSSNGLIRVTTPLGTVATTSGFAVTAPPPTITGFSPASGPIGTVVTITGTNFPSTTNVFFFNNVLATVVTINSATQIIATVPAGSSTGSIFVSAPGVTIASATNFTVTSSATSISNFSPASGPVGTSVVISGTNFTGASAVSFNNTAATTFTVNSATQITAIVPASASTGLIRVTAPGGTATSATNFTVSVPTPIITSFSPTSGPVGTSVVISGTNFTGTSAVSFNNTAATTFTVNSATQITAIVPASASTGVIRVTAPGGTATSATNYNVSVPTPTITSFSPTSGPVGTSVIISGTNFTGASAVSFNNTAVSAFTVNSATQITATVASGSSTGVVRVTTPGSTATSAGNFTVSAGTAPQITSVSNNGFTNAEVFIFGQNLGNPTSITYNGIALSAANIAIAEPTFIRIIVPANWPMGTNPLLVTTATGTSNSVPFTISHNVDNFRPGNGAYSGFVVAMNGTRLSTVNGVTIGGIAATFAVVNDTRIDVTVPSFGVLGNKAVEITTPLGGTVPGPYPLRVIAATDPIITAISPLSGPVGSVIAINGFNLNTVNSVRIGNVTLPNGTFTIVNANRINATVPVGAQTGFFINVATPTAGNLSDDRFTVTAASPSITGFSPTSGPVGTSVTITGTNFTGATAVSFNNVAAATFIVNSATQLTATVPPSASTGVIRITAPGGTAVSSANYTVTSSAPTITNVDILSAPANATITITGTNLTGAQVAVVPVALSVLSNNGTTMTVQAPNSAWSGPLVVTTASGTVQAGFFTHQTAAMVLYHRAATLLTLTGPPGASSYQWQVNQGSGFFNLFNGGVYAGVTSRTLTVNSIPTAASGYQYRVVINGSATQPSLTLRFVTYAKNNGAWNSTATWEGGLIPDVNTDVILDDVSVNVNVNASVRTLTLSPSVQLNVLSNFNLTIRK